MNFVRFAVRLAGALSACSLIAYLASFPISDNLRNVAIGGLLLWLTSEWEWHRRK